jgi:hypothetical protein
VGVWTTAICAEAEAEPAVAVTSADPARAHRRHSSIAAAPAHVGPVQLFAVLIGHRREELLRLTQGGEGERGSAQADTGRNARFGVAGAYRSEENRPA